MTNIIQTRSEETGLKYHTSLADALEVAKNDISIWKISFSLSTGERVRLVSRHGLWVYEPIVVGE